MKMAKPSAQDVKAAEELLHVLQLIAAWGGPWPNPTAGENLCELLNNGETAFDYANTTHLQTLYNNLARLQRTACPARVISGMCHVIMYEKNEILDPESDCIDLHPRFAQQQAQIEQLQAECETLRGLQPAPPPRPPEGEGLPRYGLRWNGPGQPLSVPMDDGYWTPWHLANSAADHSEDARPLVLDECVPGTYAIRYRDNWDGQGDIYHAIAEKTARGEWVHNESGTRLLQFEGDAILAAWLLAATPASSAGGVE